MSRGFTIPPFLGPPSDSKFPKKIQWKATTVGSHVHNRDTKFDLFFIAYSALTIFNLMC